MEDFSFTDLLSYQAANTKLSAYKNEFATMQALYTDECCKLRQRMSEAWLEARNQQFSPLKNKEEMVLRSNRLREQGNKLYIGSGTERDVLGAGRSYTKAIFAAPHGTETLALAHANRAMVLQEFGYYQQAYDDCLCALAEGQYPKRLRHKVVTRQAYCAWRLRDEESLRRHLQELEKSALNESFTKSLAELRTGLEELLKTEKGKQKAYENDFTNDLTNEKTKIVQSGGARGRYMIATQPIAANEVIFREHITSFVPVGDWQSCQQCAVTLMIPFPCAQCHGQAVYCSLHCRQMHAQIHAFECAGHRLQLLNQIGISQLALRVVLEQLPTTAVTLYDLDNAEMIWEALYAADGIVQRKKPNYVHTLNLISHLQCMALPDIKQFAIVADLLVIYLKRYTQFFTILTQSSAASCGEWELVTASLILRHIGQFIANAHTCVSLLPAAAPPQMPADCGFLLADALWSSPLHIRRGLLHKLNNFSEISAANLPYLSICNHACEPSFQPMFSGRLFTAFANKEIKIGEEILNCYTSDYRHSLREVRHAHLKDVYHFECVCDKCIKRNPDEHCLKYHRYRCFNHNCRKIFTPSVQALNWWQLPDENGTPAVLPVCGYCSQVQPVNWFNELKHMLNSCTDANACKLLFQKFRALNKFLLDFHCIKKLFANELINVCFQLHYVDLEAEELVYLVKFYLDAIVDQSSQKCIEYAAAMTYLWDLIALKQHKCTQPEMQNMLDVLKVVSDEYKIVFLNYYQSYMKELIT